MHLAGQGLYSCTVNENKFYKGFHREEISLHKPLALLGGLAHFHVNTTLVNLNNILSEAELPHLSLRPEICQLCCICDEIL